MKIKHNRIDLPGFYKIVFGRDGVFLANQNDFYVGGALIRYGEFSHLEMDTFEKFLSLPDMVLVEIGANIGAHTVGLSKKVKRLVAFEPQPQVFYNLCANIALNSIQNVDCYNVGLGSEASTLYLPEIDHSKPNNFGGISLLKEGKYEIPIRTLDSYNLNTQFIKIDVEGMETDVLKGSVNTINKCKPVMYIENDRKEKSIELIEYLWSLNYKLYWDCPNLFNPHNFFGKSEDYAPNIVSVNMICLPDTIAHETFNLPRLITDSTQHVIHGKIDRVA